MRKLYIISEGRTECNFIKNVLAGYLFNYDWITISTTLVTGKNSIGIHKGGWRSSDGYQNALKQIHDTLNIDKEAVYTTFFDLYGFPSDIPCYELSQSLTSPYDKARLYETQLQTDIANSFEGSHYNFKFVPYIQPYEFESFLFVDPFCTACELADYDENRSTTLEMEIKTIASSFESPEHVNNSPITAPSKRIETLVPGFVKNKAGRAGLSWRIAQSVGIIRIRQACLHFNDWLSRLENYQ
jgi:hypothetical protein